MWRAREERTPGSPQERPEKMRSKCYVQDKGSVKSQAASPSLSTQDKGRILTFNMTWVTEPVSSQCAELCQESAVL